MRHICSKESPMPENHSGLWQHPDAQQIGSSDEFYGGSYDIFKCPNCGLDFKVTVAE